jgi:hypothetical protein
MSDLLKARVSVGAVGALLASLAAAAWLLVGAAVSVDRRLTSLEVKLDAHVGACNALHAQR